MKLKTFDAVATARRWREDAGRRLDAMGISERIAFLEGLRDRGAARGGAAPSCVVREDTATYGGKPGNNTTP